MCVWVNYCITCPNSSKLCVRSASLWSLCRMQDKMKLLSSCSWNDNVCRQVSVSYSPNSRMSLFLWECFGCSWDVNNDYRPHFNYLFFLSLLFSWHKHFLPSSRLANYPHGHTERCLALAWKRSWCGIINDVRKYNQC